MLLLFVGGVMNLYVIAALTTLVAIEKIARTGELGSRLTGGVLIALARVDPGPRLEGGLAAMIVPMSLLGFVGRALRARCGC